MFASKLIWNKSQYFLTHVYSNYTSRPLENPPHQPACWTYVWAHPPDRRVRPYALVPWSPCVSLQLKINFLNFDGFWRKARFSWWWFQIISLCSPLFIGRFPIKQNIFQVGWNHQSVFPIGISIFPHRTLGKCHPFSKMRQRLGIPR